MAVGDELAAAIERQRRSVEAAKEAGRLAKQEQTDAYLADNARRQTESPQIPTGEGV